MTPAQQYLERIERLREVTEKWPAMSGRRIQANAAYHAALRNSRQAVGRVIRAAAAYMDRDGPLSELRDALDALPVEASDAD